MSYMDNVNNFKNEIRAKIGGEPGSIQTDENWPRIHVAEKPHKKDGSYFARAPPTKNQVRRQPYFQL